MTSVVPTPTSSRTVTGHRGSTAVPTGFPSLDRALAGGFRPGELVVLGGDVGSGTSALALGVALRVAAGGTASASGAATPRALLLSGEMAPERVIERAVAIEARVPLEALRLDALDLDQLARFQAASARLRTQAPAVRWLGAGGPTVVADALASGPGAQLVVVDGLEALFDGAAARDDVLAAGVLALKRLAVERAVVVLLVTHLPQLDRERTDRRPRLADFGVRGAVGVHADVVFGLYREELYETDLGVTGAAELLMLKRRDGPPGYVDLYFDRACLRFEDMLDDYRRPG